MLQGSIFIDQRLFFSIVGDKRVIFLAIIGNSIIGSLSFGFQNSANAGELISVDATLTKTCTPDSQFEPGTITWEIVTTNTSPDDVSVLNVSCSGDINGVPEPFDAINVVFGPGGGVASSFQTSSLSADTSTDTITCTFEDPVGGTFERTATAECEVEAPIQVDVDVKPQSCPNPIKSNNKGVLPVAILGTDSFDVTQIDVDSVTLEGVSPKRSNIEDVATPLQVPTVPEPDSCTDEGPDGFDDLTLKFDMQEVVATLGSVSKGDVIPVKLEGQLLDGTPIEGYDLIIIK